jgi:hypothetical protein
LLVGRISAVLGLPTGEALYNAIQRMALVPKTAVLEISVPVGDFIFGGVIVIVIARPRGAADIDKKKGRRRRRRREQGSGG